MTSDYHDHDGLPPLTARRRAIFERAVAKFHALGTPIDSDAAFVELVGKWIDGNVEMREVARLYAEARRRSGRMFPKLAAVDNVDTGTEKTAQEKLIDELEQVIGIYERE